MNYIINNFNNCCYNNNYNIKHNNLGLNENEIKELCYEMKLYCPKKDISKTNVNNNMNNMNNNNNNNIISNSNMIHVI